MVQFTTSSPGDTAVPARTPERRHLHKASLVSTIAVLVLTGTLALVVDRSSTTTEHRLLDQQLAQAGGTLTNAATNTSRSLVAGVAAAAAPTATNTAAFTRIMNPLAGPDRQFVSVSLWDADEGTLLVNIGEAPRLADLAPSRRASFLARARSETTLAVINLLHSPDGRLGFAATEPATGSNLIAYAESRLPPHRAHIQQRGDAYEQVDYGLYLGRSIDRNNLIAASRPTLPKSTRRTRVVPFGDSELLFVFAPRGDIAGWLSSNLAWIVTLIGVLLATTALCVVESITRGRDRAATLAADNAILFREQRRIAIDLQRSLLPRALATGDHFEIAAEYAPAASQSEIGGDWYDVMALGSPAKLFVAIGDVSGHGVRAAATMASLRFAARAYAAEGYEPAVILEKLGELIDTSDDAQFATVLCGHLDLDEPSIVLASAGHPHGLLRDDRGVRFIETPIGPPVGVAHGTTYEQTSMRLGEAGHLLLFTDGLVEQRGEAIETGLERLREVAARDGSSVATWVQTIVRETAGSNHDDDLAVLGVKWTRRH